MKRTATIAALLVLASVGSAQAQAQKAQKSSEKASGFMATVGITDIYSMSKNFIMKTAEQVPAEKYGYQPTKDVRTVGQLLGHIADAQNYFCATIAGTPKEYAVVAEKLEGKEALTAALKASFDNCDAVFAKLTDQDLTKSVSVFGQNVPLSKALTMNAAHDMEHYGNLVTYMRMNGMVPPSSQGGGM